MKVFISYAREDAAIVKQLRDDIERPKVEVWYDKNLRGGQDWWLAVLGELEQCDVFLYVLSNRSIRSTACNKELAYAVQLKRNVLAAKVDGVPVSYAPEPFARSEIIDYTRRLEPEHQVATLRNLWISLDGFPPADPLPDPRPDRPDAPISYLGGHREAIEGSAELGYAQQAKLLRDLVGTLSQEEDLRDDVLRLLAKLLEREDVAHRVHRDLERVLASPPTEHSLASPPPGLEPDDTTAVLTPTNGVNQLEPAHEVASGIAPTEESSQPELSEESDASHPTYSIPAGWYPDPAGRFELRYWDGNAWTEHVGGKGQQFTDPPVA